MSTLDELWEAMTQAWDTRARCRAAAEQAVARLDAAVEAVRSAAAERDQANAALREAEMALARADLAYDAASEGAFLAEQERRAAEETVR